MLGEKMGISHVALPWALLILMGISELSDAFDGYLARKYDQVTDFGKIVDPMADSISRLTYLLAFTTGVVQLPVLLVFVFFYRDSVISALRTLCALRGFALAARTSGKVKAVIQAIAITTILLMMIPHSLELVSTKTLQNWSLIAVSIAALFTIGSGIEYIIVNRHYIYLLLTNKSEA